MQRLRVVVYISAKRVGDRLGVKTRAFHLGDYRRAHMGPGKDVPHDYFFVNGEDSTSTRAIAL
jgi:hypothetical protein